MTSLLTPPDCSPVTPTLSKPSQGFPTEPPAPASRRIVLVGPQPASRSYSSYALSLADRVASGLTSSLISYSFPPAVVGARKAIVAIMTQSITWGQLHLTQGDSEWIFPQSSFNKNTTTTRAEGDNSVSVHVKVYSDAFWLRLVTLGDLGFAESYMAGECEVSDLPVLFKVSLPGGLKLFACSLD
jgi:cyclopropane-fatty-acyl-phospholipid synthase